jgi:hypothetical protein
MTIRFRTAAARPLGKLVVKIVFAAGPAATLVAGLGGNAQAQIVSHAAWAGRAVTAAPARPATASPPALFVQSCTGRSFCLATGTYSKPGHGLTSFIEEWNGKTWRIIRNPNGFSGNVTCGTPTFCLAGGSSAKGRSVEFEWNGKSWHRFTAQPPDSWVTCLSARFCVTLTGGQFYNQEMYWTGGTTWSAMPETGIGCGGAWCQTTSFSCGSATNCSDTGDYCGDSDCDNGIFNWADVWNGTVWNDNTSNGPGFGGDLACAGRSFCMTVNPAQAAISDDWQQTWHSASEHLTAACHKLGNCGFPTRPVCASSTFCMALPGQDPTGALIWNGTKWAAARLALIGSHLPKMSGLACGTPANCVATGSYQATPRSTPKPIAEHWNGTTWQVTKVVIP